MFRHSGTWAAHCLLLVLAGGIWQAGHAQVTITGNTAIFTGESTPLTANGTTPWSQPTGGTITAAGSDFVHTFTASGTFTTDQAIPNARVLVVAGGGGGGFRHAGGGGAGGYLHISPASIPSGSTPVTVGAGGAGASTGGAQSPATHNGGNSTFDSWTAIGGGYGGTNGAAGQLGGSGGGGSNGSVGGNGTAGQGNKGGNHGTTSRPYGCGGGGAGAAGANASGASGSPGGIGISNDITGTPIFYAGGGGGGTGVATLYAGGNGGGGAGGNNVAPYTGTAGTPNTGGGGGGGGASGSTSGSGGNGGSGVVIIRYPSPYAWTSSDPTVATVHPLTGVVTGIGPGTATITYTSLADGSTNTTVTVTLAITGTTSVCIGATSDLAATGQTDWMPPTGGTITSVGSDQVHTFTASGTFSTPQALDAARVLIVGGGGGGGKNGGGGGGAGGYIHTTSFAITAGATAVTVGAGGATAASNNVTGSNGSASAFGALSALGGGGGASRDGGGAANNGGSGGGGAGTNGGGTNVAGTGQSGQGSNGGAGTGNQSCNSAGGGGGGAGGTGTPASNNVGGDGGPGLQNDITGTTLFYAAGGGGGTTNFAGCGGVPAPTFTNGTGGSGIGGNGESSTGAANTGSGGGAERSGGTGVVIVRYTPPVQWVSSDPAVATVHPQTGLVTGISPGTTTITFTATTGATCDTLVTVAAPAIPSVSIASSAADNVGCNGGMVTFTATPTHGGTGPTYQWRKGGADISGETAATYTTSTLADGDQISVVMASNHACPATPTAVSNTLTHTVFTPAAASVLAVASQTVAATHECTDGSGWTHYFTFPGNQLVLSVEKGSNDIGTLATGLTVTANTSSAWSASTAMPIVYVNNYVTNPGWHIMNRWWDVHPLSQPITDVKVCTYYTQEDLDGLRAATGDISLDHNTLQFYKINNDPALGAPPYNLDPANGHADIPAATDHQDKGYWQYLNAGSASTNTWAWADLGSGRFSATYTVNQFSGGGGGASPSSTGAFPVEWLAFEAMRTPTGDARLVWATASETNNAGFTLERSHDGTTFTETGFVTGMGNSQTIQQYEFLYPGKESAWFRIRQTDLNGHSTHSETRFLASQITGIYLIPNPIRGHTKLLGSLPAGERVQVEVFSADGKRLFDYTGTTSVEAELNRYLPQLSPGLYLFQLTVGTEQVFCQKMRVE